MNTMQVSMGPSLRAKRGLRHCERKRGHPLVAVYGLFRLSLLVTTLLTLLLIVPQPSIACTSVIVSGHATKDGRPMIFKHRDSSKLHNMTLIVQGPIYRYLGLVNAEDTIPAEVWGGHNEAGFAIINTAAYNLNGDGGDTDCDGILIKKALGLCATLEDFEQLLDTVKKPREVNSNFAVLDAYGGCAYYETGNYDYVKFDVNDPHVAPNGYLVRTNFGTTGNPKLEQGVERYLAITEFMEKAHKHKRLEHTYLITQISRYMRHGLTKLNMTDYLPESENEPRYFAFHDYITRYSSASVMLVHGVKPQESPLNTVSWTIIGWPLTTVAIPLSLAATKLPALVTDDGTGHSRLNEMGLKLKSRVFDLTRGTNTEFYGNIAPLINLQGTGMLQKLIPMEKEVIRLGEIALNNYRVSRDPKELDAYYDWVDDFLTGRYEELFFSEDRSKKSE